MAKSDKKRPEGLKELTSLLEGMNSAQSEVSKAISWYAGSLSLESVMEPIEEAVKRGRDNSSYYIKSGYWTGEEFDHIDFRYAYETAIGEIDEQISLLKEEIEDYAFKAIREANYALFEGNEIEDPSTIKVREVKIDYYLNAIRNKLKLIRELSDELSKLRATVGEALGQSPWPMYDGINDK